MYIYVYLSRWWCRGVRRLCKAFIRFVFTCAAIGPNGKYSGKRLHNTKPAQSLRKKFSKRNSWKKNRSDNKMAALEASVYPVTISPFTKQTKVVPKVFQKGRCCLEGLINLAFGLQLQMLPRLNGHFMSILIWFCT